MSDLNNDIQRYLRGEMSPKEMHELEKKALSDSFLADALEGGASIDQQDFSADIESLNKSINKYKHKKKRVAFTPIRIAAGVVLLISLSLYWYLSPNPESTVQIVQTESKETKPDSVVTEVQPTTQSSGQTADRPKLLSLKKKGIEKSDEATPPVIEQTESDTTTITEPTLTEQIAEAPTVAESKTDNRHTITGTITMSEDGLPLPGATVVVKGTTIGTTTDINGNYAIAVPDDQPLVISFIGMHTNEVATKDKSKLDVKMAEDVSQLSEVVITKAPLREAFEEGPVVKLAEPVGGYHAYDKYLERGRKYPQQALDNDVKGKVIVGFDISTSGEILNMTVLRSLGFGCDEEVMRLVKEGPQWNPTTEDSKPVVSSVRVKMKFDAAKFKSKKKK